MQEKPIKPANIPNNSTNKLMWGALSVIAISLLSVTLIGKIIPGPQRDLSMLPVEPIGGGGSTLTCKIGVNNYSFRTMCKLGSYRYVDYKCHGWDFVSAGSQTSCKSAQDWYKYALDDCSKKGNPSCSNIPAPTPTIPPTPVACLAPGNYCLNSNLRCCNGTCNIEGFCASIETTPPPPTPSMPNPTPSPVNSRVSACQKLYSMYCSNSSNNNTCALIKDACNGYL